MNYYKINLDGDLFYIYKNFAGLLYFVKDKIKVSGAITPDSQKHKVFEILIRIKSKMLGDEINCSKEEFELNLPQSSELKSQEENDICDLLELSYMMANAVAEAQEVMENFKAEQEKADEDKMEDILNKAKDIIK